MAAGGGPAGSFLQFDGFDWSVRSSGGSQAVVDVGGISGPFGPVVFMVGDGGSAFVAVQDTVLAIETGTSTNLRAVFALAWDNIIVVGDDGTMLAIDLTDLPYSGADVRPLAGPAADLTGIAFRGYNDLFLCAADGSIFTHNRCSARSSKAGGSGLLHIARVSDHRVVAVGEGGTILSYSRPAPAECPDAVSISISTGTTPTFSWSPDCPVSLVLVEQGAGDMWLIESDGNVIRPGVRYGDHHPCETDFWYEDALTPGVEYKVILFRYNSLLDTYTLIALETFVP